MRVLIIGDAYSIFVYAYIRYTLHELNIKDIVILNFSEEIVKKPEIEHYYDQKGVVLLPKTKESLGNFEKMIYFLQEIENIGYFDVCHVHSMERKNMTMGILLRKSCRILIANYWGSDWICSGTEIRKEQKKLLDISDYIVTDAMHIYDGINEEYMNQYKEKLKFIRFKQPIIEEMKSKKHDEVREEQFFCDTYGISKEKIKIVCGYSGLRRHKHALILNEIAKLDEKQKKQIFIILPSTYGKSDSYVVELQNILENMHVEYCILTKNLTSVEVAALRNLTDIFINVQGSDAYSATLVEYVYCNKIIICGKWLNYSQLEKEGAFFEKINKVEFLSEMIARCLSAMEKEKQKFANNQTAAKNFMEKYDDNVLWLNLFNGKEQHKNIEINMQELIFQEIIYWSKINLRAKRNSEILQTMLMIENFDKKIQAWSKQYRGKKIGIYGAGEMGKVVYYKLQMLDINDVLVFDQNLPHAGWYLQPIKKPFDMENFDLNLLIITPVMYLDILKEKYKTKSRKVLTILDWIKEISEYG